MQPWSYSEPTRIEDILERLEQLRAMIAFMAERPVSPCGSDDNPHMWVELKRNDGTRYTVCGKCGAAF